MNRVIKVDNTAEEGGGMVGMIVLPPAHVCGEFSYVSCASPCTAASKQEDDGWLVAFCTDDNSMQSFFLVRFCPACYMSLFSFFSALQILLLRFCSAYLSRAARENLQKYKSTLYMF
jgi:hypothetical protein